MKKVVCLISLLLLTACSIDPTGSGNNTDSGYAFSIVNNSEDFVCSLQKDGAMTSNDEMKLNNLYPMMENTFSNLPDATLLDSELTDYLYGAVDRDNGGMRALSFFKFTFYVKNVCESPFTPFNLRFNIQDVRSENSKGSLINTLRLMVFENNADLDTHDYEIYAEKTNNTNIDRDGNAVNKEFVAEHAEQEDDEHPLVTSNFKQDSLETNDRYVLYSNKSFAKDVQLRYTMVIWLEGNDPDSITDQQAPSGTSLRLSVEISN